MKFHHLFNRFFLGKFGKRVQTVHTLDTRSNNFTEKNKENFTNLAIFPTYNFCLVFFWRFGITSSDNYFFFTELYLEPLFSI